MQFGDQVVVVGIEPLGHLAGCGADAVGRPAAGHAKVGRERRRIGVAAETRRHGAEHDAVVQDVVVKREVAHGNVVQAGGGLDAPVALAQRAGGGLQCLLVVFAAPVGFERPLELAFGADAGESRIVYDGH